ncbi:MAG TPA: hypothetical protein VFK44_07295 [Bacillales bacterium]|nr:hypothetical protein [Bacillales bacterium]
MKTRIVSGAVFLFLLVALALSRNAVDDWFIDVEWLLLFGLLFLWLRPIFFVGGRLPTSSAAMIMSFGIFMSGVSRHFSLFTGFYGKIFAIALFALWVYFIGVYVKDLLDSGNRKFHLGDPVGSFGIGTWVAATSVTGTILVHRVPEFAAVAEVMAGFNVFLWALFFGLCVKNFVIVFRNRWYEKMHGIILLSTVATESVLIFCHALFRDLLPHVFAVTLLLIGTFFYMIGFLLIVLRYLRTFRQLRWIHEWTNTNCILHGSMSITGLAGILSNAVSDRAAVAIWLWVFVWFIIVESCETVRAVIRVKQLGFARGIGSYNVTQWARNFTFGMFFAFTMHLRVPPAGWLSALHHSVLTYFAWIVVLLFLNEVLLLVKRSRSETKVNMPETFGQ